MLSEHYHSSISYFLLMDKLDYLNYFAVMNKVAINYFMPDFCGNTLSFLLDRQPNAYLARNENWHRPRTSPFLESMNLLLKCICIAVIKQHSLEADFLECHQKFPTF